VGEKIRFTSSILPKWARRTKSLDALLPLLYLRTGRKRNELIISGNPVFLPRASCWPLGVTEFLLVPMTMALYFVQGPKEVVMIKAGFNDVRQIHLTEKHSTNVRTWYGESIGRYEGDTLVVDTIGLDDRTSVDEFGTPHTKQLHVIERFHLIDWK
jgi:hypothetical protein